jgi:hypothetical protein
VQSIVGKEEVTESVVSSPILSFTNKKSIAALSRKLDLQPNHDHYG